MRIAHIRYDIEEIIALVRRYYRGHKEHYWTGQALKHLRTAATNMKRAEEIFRKIQGDEIPKGGAK